MKTFGELLAGVDGGDALVQKFGRESLEESVSAMAKSYQSAEQRIHGTVKPPSAEASDEEWADFMHKVGAPQGQDEYKAPEGVDESVAKKAAAIAIEANMTQRQYDRLVSQLDMETKAEIEKQSSVKTQIQKTYGEEYGAAKARAMRAAAQLKEDGQEVSDIEANPALFAALEQYGATMADDTQPLDTTSPGNSSKPSEKEVIDAAEKAREIMDSGQMARGSENFAKANREYEQAMMVVLGAGFESAFDPRLMREYDPYLRYSDPNHERG